MAEGPKKGKPDDDLVTAPRVKIYFRSPSVVEKENLRASREQPCVNEDIPLTTTTSFSQPRRCSFSQPRPPPTPTPPRQSRASAVHNIEAPVEETHASGRLSKEVILHDSGTADTYFTKRAGRAFIPNFFNFSLLFFSPSDLYLEN